MSDAEPLVDARDLRARVPHGRRARARGARRVARRRARRVRRDRRTVGLRQVDAAQSARRHRPADVGRGDDRRRSASTGMSDARRDAVPAATHRLRLPALLPDAGADGARERRAADGRGRVPRERARASARASCSRTSDSASGATIGRRSSRAASSSASRSRARWRTDRSSCSPTSRRASSTRGPAPR